MGLFKGKLKLDKFLELLLEARMHIDNKLQALIFDNGFEGDKQLLNLDTTIFSLWMISLTLPSKKHKDLMHEKICNQFRISENEIKIFYEEIKKRYSNYYYAYNKWVENPQNSLLLGSVITETIVNQNSNFSIQETLPYTDFMVNMEMFAFFADNFKIILNVISEMKKKYRIPALG